MILYGHVVISLEAILFHPTWQPFFTAAPFIGCFWLFLDTIPIKDFDESRSWIARWSRPDVSHPITGAYLSLSPIYHSVHHLSITLFITHSPLPPSDPLVLLWLIPLGSSPCQGWKPQFLSDRVGALMRWTLSLSRPLSFSFPPKLNRFIKRLSAAPRRIYSNK